MRLCITELDDLDFIPNYVVAFHKPLSKESDNDADYFVDRSCYGRRLSNRNEHNWNDVRRRLSRTRVVRS